MKPVAQVTSVRCAFSRRVEFCLVFLSFETEYDEFFLTVLRNVMFACLYYLMEVQIASALLVLRRLCFFQLNVFCI